jgi:hypothetical protein
LEAKKSRTSGERGAAYPTGLGGLVLSIFGIREAKFHANCNLSKNSEAKLWFL